jgi:two-component system, NtrC family, response regulator PilR
MPPRALIVDDEPDIRELLAITLSRMQLEVDTAGDYASAVRQLGGQRYDLVLTDMRLPDGDGLDLLEWIQTHRPGVPVAVITAHGNVEAAVRALKLGCVRLHLEAAGPECAAQADHDHAEAWDTVEETLAPR